MSQPPLDELHIGQFETKHWQAVVDLWRKAGRLNSLAVAEEDIRGAQKYSQELFLVARLNEAPVGTAMGAFDGRRGWLDYLVTDPAYDFDVIARPLVDVLESKLKQRGCETLCLVAHERLGEDAYTALGFVNENAKLYRKGL